VFYTHLNYHLRDRPMCWRPRHKPLSEQMQPLPPDRLKR
jgi:hypothetical protein